MLDRPVAPPVINLEKEKSIIGAHIASAVVVALSALNLSGYLYMAGSEMLVPLLNAVGKFVFFPFAALSSIMYAATAWYHYSLEPKSKFLLAKAIVETIGAVMMTAGVIGYLAFAPIFGVVGPALFASFLGLKTLFQFGTAIYYGYKVLTTNDHVKKHEYRHKVKHAILSTVAGALTTFALAAVEIFAAPYLAIFGIMSGAFAAAFAIVRIIDSAIKLQTVNHLQRVAREANGDVELVRTNNAKIMEVLNRDSTHSHSQDEEIGHERLAIPMRDLSESSVEEALPAPLKMPANDDSFEEVPLDSEEIVYRMRQ